MSRAAAGARVMPPNVYTYSILIDCCTRAQRPDLALAFFGQLLRTGLGVNEITFSNLLRSMCKAKRTEEALDVVLHRMHELGCAPNVFSYNILLKSFCDNGDRGRACGLLRRMIEKGAGCSPDVVSYSTLIHAFFKEGEVAKACDLFDEMTKQQGISPSLQWTRQRQSFHKCLVMGFGQITGHIIA
nr:unnamed protein product [Digitaria exilis]